MRFWDASALVPLVVAEPKSNVVAQLVRDDPEIVVAWTATIECTSACVRRHRERTASDAQLVKALTRLRELSGHWSIAEPTHALMSLAEKIVVRHALRAGDAIQLASAAVAGGDGAPPLEFVCFDQRLNLAAVAEGLRVVSATS